jgi:hypothetical protein
MDGSNLKLNDVKIRKQYQVRVSNRFAVFGELRLKRSYKYGLGNY